MLRPNPNGPMIPAAIAPVQRGVKPWHIAAVSAGGVMLGFFGTHLYMRSAEAKTIVAPKPKVTPPPGALPRVMEVTQMEQARAIQQGNDTLVFFGYCKERPGSQQARVLLEQLSQRPDAQGIDFVAVESEVDPSGDLAGLCSLTDGIVGVQRRIVDDNGVPVRVERISYEEDPMLRVNATDEAAEDGSYDAQTVFDHALTWALGTTPSPQPNQIELLRNVWMPLDVQPTADDVVRVPVGATVYLPLTPPLNVSEAMVDVINIEDRVTGAEGGPWVQQNEDGSTQIGFIAQQAGSTVFTVKQGGWREQAWIEALA